MSKYSERRRVVREARSWLGTPFHHGARLKGQGVDCAQLLIAVYTAAGLAQEPELGFYSPNWFLHEDLERFLQVLAPNFCETPQPELGDVVLFRYGRAISHGAILIETSPERRVIHSFRGFGVVIDSIEPGTPLAERLVGFWTLRHWSA